MTGHIRRRGDRSWEIKFDLGTDPATGKRLTRYHSFKGTKREAEVELTRLKAGANAGDYIDPSKLTVGEFLDVWERDWAANNVSPKTLERYKELIVNHIRPRLGAMRVQKLKPVHLIEFYATLLREGRLPCHGARVDTRGPGLSPRTVGHIHRILYRAFGHAVLWGVIAASPIASIEPPSVEDTEIEILTEDQPRAVLSKLKGRSLYPVILLALSTGMRRGELLGLRWKDVDLDQGKVKVEQSLEQTKAGLRFKAPKTKHGRRAIALPASVVSEIRGHWKTQQEQRLKLGQGKASPDDLVFAVWDGSARRPNSLTTEWRRMVTTLSLPKVSLHALRHTHASQLIASGMDVLTISRRLGHSSPTITLGVYGHLFTNSDDRAAAIVEAAFGKTLTE